MSWVGPSEPVIDEDNVYRTLVVDSGPIIRRTGLTSLRGRAKTYYTVPAVMQEIRDAKAREHLGQLPFELVAREPTKEGIKAVIEFSKKTGDFQSLSTVDLQVLALLYDLEQEGCGDMSHVRKIPKRTVGVGKIQSLAKKEEKKEEEQKSQDAPDDDAPDAPDAVASVEKPSFFESHEVDIVDDSDDDDEEDDSEDDNEMEENREQAPKPAAPKSWAALLNPNAGSSSVPKNVASSPAKIADQAMSVPFGKMNLSAPVDDATGQFSDAEDEDDEIVEAAPSSTEQVETALEEDLQSDFPSLQAALTVAYEGSDDEDEEPHVPAPITFTREEQEELKKKSLQPISNSGKLYNSFRKYGNLMKPKEPVKKKLEEPKIEEEKAVTESPAEISDDKKMQSRIIGGMGMSGQENMVEDDGEGWITNTRDLQSMKSQGILDPLRSPSDKAAVSTGPVGPPITQRTACTTTDFAMQNVILQMNLELLSVDGIKIRRLKSWVSRCGACYKIYTDGTEGPSGMKRLFCAHCGSDMMQRIAASVDSKTGRLRLHMSKKYKNNLRGTKFSLPKAGSGNRFQGDLLLREDQLMTGAWNQKVKMRSGGKSRANAQSIFGKDLASNVGCNAKVVDSDDIRVGFGRRNPNAAKGRERRGKKKKSDDKACGLRRY
jgi:RNA-binding protein NOB1